MKKERSVRREIIAIAASLAVVIFQGVEIVGQKAHLPVILTLIIGGFTAGIAAGRLIQKLRSGKGATMAEEAGVSVQELSPGS